MVLALRMRWASRIFLRQSDIHFISEAQFIRRASAVQNLILHLSSTEARQKRGF